MKRPEREIRWGPVTEIEADWGFAPGCRIRISECRVVSGGYLLHATDCPNRFGTRVPLTASLR